MDGRPEGLTAAYLEWRAARAWGMKPWEFRFLDRVTQVRLIAYLKVDAETREAVDRWRRSRKS